MRNRALSWLPLLGFCGCAGLGVYKGDVDLHEQVRVVVEEHGRPHAGHNARIGRVSTSLVAAQEIAKSHQSTSLGVSSLSYEGVSDRQICFTHLYSNGPEWQPSEDELAAHLQSWRWVVAFHRSLGEFASKGAAWPVPPTSGFDSIKVVKNHIVEWRDGTHHREVKLELCGPAPQSMPDAKWLVVLKVNPAGSMEDNEIFLWGITDADEVDTGYKGGLFEKFDFTGSPADASASPPAQSTQAAPPTESNPAKPEAREPTESKQTHKGKVHAPDPKDLLGVLTANGHFATFIKAMDQAGLTELLTVKGHWMDGHTVFAPTDEAFATLGEAKLAALLADTARLKSVLQSHIVERPFRADEFYTATAASPSRPSTVNHKHVRVWKEKGKLIVEKQTVTVDLEADNGYVHGINGVIEL